MSTSSHIIIVGGVAGGMSAATRMRRLMEDATITVLERSGHVSFANCGLPYHVGGVIEERSALLLQTPASLGARFGLDVRVLHEAVSIDREHQTLTVRDLANDETFEMPYDALVLSPGARPVRPPIPGIERAYTLRDIEDTDALVAAAEGATTAVVIGGGFIGIEMAENLHRRGLEVTVVEAADQIMTPLDPEMIEPVHAHLREAGINLHLSSTVNRIDADSVGLADGRRLPADLVVAAIGVRPDVTLAVEAGLDLGTHGGIAVDAHLRTSDPHIFAVGDAVEKRDANGTELLVPLAGPANRQGRLVADVIAGRPVSDRPVQGSAILGVLDLQIAVTGRNEKTLTAAGRPIRIIHSHPMNHAGYYPGAEKLALKLIVDPETDLILGAQAVGGAGVDKRIDVISTAMRAGLTASELVDLDLTYAPQFGSAKDPVNMLGYMNANQRDGLVETVQWHEVEKALSEGATLLDVRTVAEHEAGSIPGALNIPLDDLRSRIDEVPKDVVAFCAVGLRGYLASRLLSQHGVHSRNLDGGMSTWLSRPGAATGSVAA